MWQYLSMPNSIALVALLVEDGWGVLTLEDSVRLHKQSITFAWIDSDVVLALANIELQGPGVFTLRYWINPIHRSLRDKPTAFSIFEAFIHYAKYELKVKTLIAYTTRRSIVKTCCKRGARSVGYIRSMYGYGKDGYIVAWEF